ncbi:hypothetical protein RSA42_06275 [Exiguobacterium indicum]|uniref:DUF4305 domain-containing protein n=1 Tax=Exiguobacterium indicum TaxID=296995 RepID=UPI00073724CE|nr:DUF4305 domain-containing protein [Exiguobacterium indicum]KTR61163.1 hypothetical protein RSA42_06275 [Exiguobacterium indicum]
MRQSSNFMAVFYAIFGILFMFLAYNNSVEAGTVFNFWTILLTLFAAIDFYRLYLIFRFRAAAKKVIKKEQDKKNDKQ